MALKPLPVTTLPRLPAGYEAQDATRGNFYTISLRGPNQAGEEQLVLVRHEDARAVDETGPVSLDFLATLLHDALPLPPTTPRERIDYAAGQVERAIQALDRVHTVWANRREASDDTTEVKDRATLALHDLAKCLYRDQALHASYGARATAAPGTDEPVPAQAGNGNLEGSRIEALDDQTDPTQGTWLVGGGRHRAKAMQALGREAGGAPACRTCGGSGTVEVGKGTLRPHERGCPACPAGADFERLLASSEAAQRERDLDATGQDQEAFDGV